MQLSRQLALFFDFGFEATNSIVTMLAHGNTRERN
jgi:hypothetical protein